METKSKNVIELNGKRYDASTGKIVGVGSAPAVPANRSIDGFFRTTRSSQTSPDVQQAHKITVLATPAAGPQPKHPKAKRIIVHTQPHKPQSATTLMRRSVKRPEPGFKQQATVQGSLQHKVPSLIVPKKSVSSLDEHRLARAAAVQRSPHISHHASTDQQPIVSIASLPVQPAPQHTDEPAVPAPQQTNKPVDMFEHAIANASHFVDIQTHKHHMKKKARRHVASLAAGTLALLVVAGFAAYQNTPGLQLKIASIRAGVATSMPNFKAAGFAYNGVKSSDGMLTVGFSGRQGTYELTQQTTNWDSGDLIQNLGSTDASGTPDYSTVQVGSTPVYRMNNLDATWVSSGKWYTITGNRALSDDQVRSLVANI